MTTTTASIVVDDFIPYPIRLVWEAITDPRTIERWLMPNDFQAAVGHRFTMQATPIPAVNFDGIVHCEVAALEPPHLLAYTWTGGSLHTSVEFRLADADRNGVRGTRLHFEHSGFDLSSQADVFAYSGMGASWRSKVIPGITAAIEGLAAA